MPQHAVAGHVAVLNFGLEFLRVAIPFIACTSASKTHLAKVLQVVNHFDVRRIRHAATSLSSWRQESQGDDIPGGAQPMAGLGDNCARAVACRTSRNWPCLR